MAETDSRILEYLEEGLFLYGVGKVQESIVRWRKVLELDPRNERAMDYIESAGGDVSQYRQKAGLAPKGGAPSQPTGPQPTGPQPQAAPVPPQPPPAPVAAPPQPRPAAAPVAPLQPRAVQQPVEPLDVGAFLAATGAAPPNQRTMTPAPAPSPAANGAATPAMPWNNASAAQTVPSAPPAPAAGPPPMPSITTSVTQPSAPPQPAVAPPPPQPVAAPTPPAPQPAPQPQPGMREQLIAEAGVLFQARQFEKSLEVLERVSREFPPVDEALKQYLDAARNGLYEELKSQWPRPDIVPEIRMSANQVMSLKLSPEAGFIFSRVDGMSTVEEILAMGGLDPFTTLRALSQLLRAGVIGIQA